MNVHPAVVVHGLDDATAVLALGYPVTLLSSPDAALTAGCLWWRAVVDRARALYPGTICNDILDCADAPGRAMAALRSNQQLLVLSAACPAYPAVASAAETVGARIMSERPAALDMRDRDAMRSLDAWLAP